MVLTFIFRFIVDYCYTIISYVGLVYYLIFKWWPILRLSFATDRWFSPGIVVSSTNKTNRHDITEILLKVALNTMTLPCSTGGTSRGIYVKNPVKSHE